MPIIIRKKIEYRQIKKPIFFSNSSPAPPSTSYIFRAGPLKLYPKKIDPRIYGSKVQWIPSKATPYIPGPAAPFLSKPVEDYGKILRLRNQRLAIKLSNKTGWIPPSKFVAVPRTGNALLALVNVTETWTSHFTSRSWTTIQNQINAGYPYYLQPNENSGSYEEVRDFGVLITDSIIQVNWSTDVITGTLTTVCKIATSTDGITYSAFSTGTSLFGTSFRYIKVRLEFSGVDNNDLIRISNLTFSITVKQEVDSGLGTAVSTDAAPGTAFTFNKAFKDVNSIVATPQSPDVPYNIVVSFTDIPNPTTFYIMVFDSTGKRVTLAIKWVARGVV